MSLGCNALVYALAALALVGWFADRPRLASFHAAWIPMAPNTALSVLLLGAAATALTFERHRLAVALAALPAVTAAARALEFFADLDLGVDQWVFDFPSAVLGLAPVGRMALFTAIDLLVLSTAVVLLAVPRQRRWSQPLAGLLGAAAGLSGLTFAAAYLYDQPLAYGGVAIPMALPSALSIAGLGAVAVLRAGRVAYLERRRLEQRLRESEALFRTVFETAPIGVAVLGDGGEVERANASFETIVGGAAAGASALPAMLPPQAAEEVAAALARAVTIGEAPLAVDVELTAGPDGEPRCARLQLAAVRTTAGERLLALLRDTTDERRMHDFLSDANRLLEARVKARVAELEIRNRELQDFAYVASHDLQEPLRKVQAFSGRLAARWGDALDEEGRDYLRRMNDAATRMRRLIEDLLTFSRVTTRGQAFVPTSLDAAVRDALGDLEIRMQESRASVEVAPLPAIEADPGQMRQLFQNLLGNALKYRRPDEPPRVRVWSENGDSGEAAGHVRLLVRDEGIGFDERYLDRIFAPFQRLHGRNEYEGSGIGLAVCRRIVERHGGTLTARSVPGQGATFIVDLPLRQPREQEREHTTGSRRGAAAAPRAENEGTA